jgi:cyclohexanone monooxygenase
MADSQSPDSQTRLDALVVGAGFGGLYALYRLRRMGLKVLVYEAGSGVGGTWYWNRYPGARCDVESMEYSYSFDEQLQQDWQWTERYATQPEILRYMEHVTDRFDLRRDIRFDTRVSAARFDEASGLWQVATESGGSVSARFLVMATGPLSAANIPPFKGRDSFRGESYHTGRWPREGVEFHGKRVGIIGTGSSGIQAIPVIAQDAKELFVFQRTPNYSLPADQGPIDQAEVREIKADYKGFREQNSLKPAAGGSRRAVNTASALAATPEERERVFEDRWDKGGFVFVTAYGDLVVDPRANELAAEFVRKKIRSIVKDPKVAEKLCPTNTFGCKRLCLDTGYFETYNRPNVHLVDISQSPIEEITPKGLRTGGREYELDMIVYATGFDAMTGPLTSIDIRGRAGASLRDAWSAGPRTYLGLGIAGFPNLFVVVGPGSPSVLAVMTVAIEQQVDWIADCIGWMREQGHARVEVEVKAQDGWVEHVNAVAAKTLYPTCNSWYLGANIPGKKRVFMPLVGYPPYRKKCDEVAAHGYAGFAFS